jgi:hypothetical protein
MRLSHFHTIRDGTSERSFAAVTDKVDVREAAV